MSVAETWKAVVGYEGLYEVSSQGRVRSVDRVICKKRSDANCGFKYRLKGKVLSPAITRTGYLNVSLRNGGFSKSYQVHRLVVVAFLGEIPINKEINHKNGIKADNCVENLEIVSHAENMRHGFRIGLIVHRKGENSCCAKATEKQIRKGMRLIRNGKTMREAAATIGISPYILPLVKCGCTWKHLGLMDKKL